MTANRIPPQDAADVLRRLGLIPLDGEGGNFIRTYEHRTVLPDGRKLASAIYYLLAGEERSAWHRVRGADELWFAHGPTAAVQMIVAPDGRDWSIRRLRALPGPDFQPQATVPADCWQCTRLIDPGPARWSLFSTVVTPEFRAVDFELQTATGLLALNPRLAAALREFESAV